MEQGVMSRIASDVTTHPRYAELRVEMIDKRLYASRFPFGVGDRLLYGISVESAGCGVYLAIEEESEEELVRAMETVQDDLQQVFVITWPECPHGAHPLWPEVRRGTAAWLCHRHAHSVAVGELAG